MLLCILEQLVIGDLGIALVTKRLMEKWAKIMGAMYKRKEN